MGKFLDAARRPVGSRRQWRARGWLACAGLLIAASVSACGTGGLSNLPPSLGGMPTDAPAPPATPLAYPAVHDMPPPRSTAILTEQQLKDAEAELAAARDRQVKQSGAGKGQ